MAPLAALQTATINAADLMGWTAKTGTIEPGKWADIIAVDGNPLDDVRVLQHVKFVMKAGVVYKGQETELKKVSRVVEPAPRSGCVSAAALGLR